MNSEIETIFNNFIVDDVQIPIDFAEYTGSATTYLTYISITDDPALAGDDEILTSVIQYDIDIFTKGNYLNILKSIKTLMKNNGWMWMGDSPDMFEKDTGYFHKTATFGKERSVI